MSKICAYTICFLFKSVFCFLLSFWNQCESFVWYRTAYF